MTAVLRTTLTRYGGAVWVLVCAAAVAVFLLYARIPATGTEHSAPDVVQIENGPVPVDKRQVMLAPGVRAVTKTAPGTFALTGVAANAVTGQVVSGAKVTLVGSLTYTTRSSAAGGWAFKYVPADDSSWTIRVEAQGYGTFVQTGTTFDGGTAYEMTSALSPKP